MSSFATAVVTLRCQAGPNAHLGDRLGRRLRYGARRAVISARASDPIPPRPAGPPALDSRPRSGGRRWGAGSAARMSTRRRCFRWRGIGCRVPAGARCGRRHGPTGSCTPACYPVALGDSGRCGWARCATSPRCSTGWTGTEVDPPARRVLGCRGGRGRCRGRQLAAARDRPGGRALGLGRALRPEPATGSLTGEPVPDATVGAPSVVPTAGPGRVAHPCRR